MNTRTQRAQPLALLVLLLVGCSAARTEILIEVESDLAVPTQLDYVRIAVTGPDGRTQVADAALGGGNLPLPRTLGMAYQDGPLGPYQARVTGELGGALVVERRGTLAFRQGETLVWRVELLAECMGVGCADNQTCDRGGCRDQEVLQGELLPYDGRPIPLDAGAFDACMPLERCNGVDDDCDGASDEGFDLSSDPDNCNECGNVCGGANATGTCTGGVCSLSCEPGFGDCDGVPSNGCETDTTNSAAHCGICGQICRPPNIECCAGTCARAC